jgi:YfiH family protein
MPQPNSDLFEFFEFRRGGQVVEGAPVCGLTLKAAGSMRFRWNENNPNRNTVFEKMRWLSLRSLSLVEGSKLPQEKRKLVPVQLDHTHIVYNVHEAGDTQDKIGDGMITTNKALVPSVTVADCMPLYLYEPETGVFGIVHSGWKGTGIVVDAIKLAEKEYGARAQNFCIVIGPHIRACCYIVNEERAKWFSENFTPDCVTPLEPGVEVTWKAGGGPLYRLSLEKANLAALQKAGVPSENIWIHPACTCCTKKNGSFIYGSNRRETAAAGRPDQFTVQAAFICHPRA